MTTTNTPSSAAPKANPIQRIKQLVMLNSVLVLTVVFLAFFNPTSLPNRLSANASTTDSLVNGSMSEQIEPLPTVTDRQPVSVSTAGQATPAALAALPYVSRDGLIKQASVNQALPQVVSYQKQPRVQARSSR